MKQCLHVPRVLLPREGFETWSVIACDQFTSDRAYWERVAQRVGGAPSTLRFIIPEVYLGEDDEARIEAIREHMYEALESDQLVKYSRGAVFTERTTRDGVRRGIVAAFDLEAYSCEAGVSAPVRSSEEVLKDRLPPRVALRRAAPLEFPHAIIFYRDKKDRAVKQLLREELETLYDFDLMEGGGHITGSFVPFDLAAEILAAIPQKGEPAFAVADGNHSVAAAKAHWEEVKAGLSSAERARMHPARLMLAEFVNLYDPAVVFHPIHRLVKETDAEAVAERVLSACGGRREGALVYPALPASAESIRKIDGVLEGCVRAAGGRIDYIHGKKELARLAGEEGSLGVVLPPLEKDDFFAGLKGGVNLPKKSFSVGDGKGKRYYLEGREISYD